MNNLIILQDTTIPEAAPKKQGTNGLPGSFDQSDIEIEITASPDKKCHPIECPSEWSCDPDRFTILASLTFFLCMLSRFCAVATAQIIWPLPVT